MNARELRRLRGRVFGRKRRSDAGRRRTRIVIGGYTPPPEPAYRRVTFAEAETFARLRRRGRSLRAIGRLCRRSHHTVSRWLNP
jgi:DNA invertase Pin-like site-specific DNA recombinase